MSAGVHPWSPFHRRHDHHTGDHDFHQRHASMFGRFARGVGEAVGVLLLFVVCLVGAVLIHLRMQVGLRVVAARVNAILADSFQGKVEIRHLGAIGPFGLSGADATIYDPAGQQVLDVRGVRVRVATVAAARSALFGKVQLPKVSQARGLFNDLPWRARAALFRPIVHDSQPGCDGVHQSRAPALFPTMMGDDVNINLAELVCWAGQLELLVAGQVPKVEDFQLSECDQCSQRARILGLICRVFRGRIALRVI